MLSEYLLRKLQNNMTVRKIRDPVAFSEAVDWAAELLLRGWSRERVKDFIFTMDYEAVNRIVHAARRIVVAKKRDQATQKAPVSGSVASIPVPAVGSVPDTNAVTEVMPTRVG